MPHYLFEASYTGESWRTQVEQQENVLERIQPLLDALNGRVESLYYTFGDRDLVAIATFPDNEVAAAFSMAVAAGGSVRSARTTPLISVDEGIGALKRAAEAGAGYTPPVSTS